MAYINNPNDESTKLLACPGAGKTFSVTHRMVTLAKRHHKSNVYMCTFSRAAAEDARTKMRREYPKSGMIQQISTIHSLAGKILAKRVASDIGKGNQTRSLSLAIIHLRKFLQEWGPEESRKDLGPLEHLTDLFVDEAQDLDPYQFECIKLLNQRFGVRVHLVGDPNQCIYQFRQSSSSFFLTFNAKEFYLTRNFRSTPELVHFTNHLVIHPFEKPSMAVRDSLDTGNKVCLRHFTKWGLKNYLLDLLTAKTVDYSDYAILFPSKKSSGLYGIGASDIFDFLSLKDIPVKRYYSLSSTDSQVSRKVQDDKYVSLHTYHSSKGLEYRHVIVVDCHHELMNRVPTEGQYEDQRYLTYVALTRAKDRLDVIVHKNGMTPGIFRALVDIPKEHFENPDNIKMVTKDFQMDITVEPKCTISQILEHLPQDRLERFSELLHFEVLDETPLGVHVNYKLEEYHTFRGIIVEEYIKHLYGVMCNPDGYKSPWLNKQLIALNTNKVSAAMYKDMVDAQQNCGTWEALRTLKGRTDISKSTRKGMTLLERNIGKLSGELTDTILLYHDDTRTALYDKYIKKDVDHAIDALKTATIDNPCLKELGYLIVYYLLEIEFGHLGEYKSITEQVVDKFINDEELVEDLHEFVRTHLLGNTPEFSIKVKEPLSSINGLIDMVLDDTICEFKCTTERYTLEHLLQLWFYGLAHQQKTSGVYMLYNFHHGVKYTIKIAPNDPFEVLNILCDIGHLQIIGMHLIYDLETNGLIEQYGYPRYPYPLQICGKEYNTAMVVIPEFLLQLPINHRYNFDSGAIHKITPAMLEEHGKSFDDAKSLIKYRLRNCRNLNLWAHNNNRFDGPIVRHYELIPDEFVHAYEDTISAIRHHMTEKPDGYSIDKLCRHYKVEFSDVVSDPTKRHTAEADIDILIHLMKKCVNIKM